MNRAAEHQALICGHVALRHVMLHPPQQLYMVNMAMVCKKRRKDCLMDPSEFVACNPNPKDSKTVTALVQCCVCGSEDAWNAMYRLYRGFISGVIRRKGSFQQEVVKDLVQETFFKLHMNLHNYDPSKRKLLNHIALIAERLCIDKWRKDGGIVKKEEAEVAHGLDADDESALIFADDTGPEVVGNGCKDRRQERMSRAEAEREYREHEGSRQEPTPEELLVRKQLKRLLKRASKRLNQRCRDLIRLKFCRDLTYQEIANTLDHEATPISNKHTALLRQQTHRCLEKLRGELPGQEELGF